MSDIPKVMLDRAFAAYLAEDVRRDAGRSRVEAAIRAALQPLPMESAPREVPVLIFPKIGGHRYAIRREHYNGLSFVIQSGGFESFPDEDLAGWFPIIGVGND